jgi:hypothetical protein
MSVAVGGGGLVGVISSAGVPPHDTSINVRTINTTSFFI